MTGQFQRGAQTANMNVHRPLLDKDMITPNLIKQLGATMDALGVRHEEMQHAKFCWSKLKRLAIAENTMGNRINAQAFDVDAILSHLRGSPTQNRFDPGQ